MMKTLIVTVLTVVLGSISTTCLADGGNFFINADAGEANYHVNSPASVAPTPFGASYLSGPLFPVGSQLNNSHAAGALRFGYRWHGAVDYGVEAGYADLGQVNSTFDNNPWTNQGDLKDRGWLLGGNLKYNINNNWYVSARGGWFRPQISGSETSTFQRCIPTPGVLCPSVLPAVTFYQYQYSQTVSGEYFGVGAGFNFSSDFSLGLSYDYYRSNRLSNDFKADVGLYSLSAEYRF
jgi:OmpA-OmpF porin, OOP family